MPLYSPTAPIDATFLTQTANGILTGEQALGALATGLLKNTTGTGVQSIGVKGTDYPGLDFANTFTANQKITAALNCTRATNAFNTTSIYTAFVIGDLTGSTNDNGGMYAFGRSDKANEPFVGLSGWDNGAARTLYFGGGEWDAPDATRMEFWIAPSYSETNNTGVLIMRMVGPGVAIGTSVNSSAKLRVDQGSTTGAIPTLWLEQADLSEEVIRIETTVGAGNPIDTAAAGAYYGKLRVKVEGVAGYKVIELRDEA